MKPRPSDRGAAAVEFALVVPLLVALVMGIAEFGRAYNVQTTLSAAARDGVRVMALHNNPATARSTAKASAAGLNLRDDQIADTPTTCVTTSTTPVATARVTITYQMDLMLFPDDVTLKLTGKGSMRCNG